MKNIHIILSVLVILGCFTSCELEDRRYNGDLLVEFSPDRYGQVASPSGIVKTAAGTGQDQIGVQLIGIATSEALTVNFRLVDQVFFLISLNRYVADLPEDMTHDQYQTILATAEYGEDFTFEGLSGVTYDNDNGRGSITVSPNSQFGVIPVTILKDGGAQFFCVLDDSEDLKANMPTALLRCFTPVDRVILLDETFDTDPFGRGWTSIDKDDDGFDWTWYDNPPSITSDSYLDDEGALFPENYLISPAIGIPADAQNVTLDFQVAAGATSDFREQYRVIISDEEITYDNCRDADVLQDWTVLTEENSQKKFTGVSIDITDYKGKTVYVGIVHGQSTDQYYILVRNLIVYTH